MSERTQDLSSATAAIAARPAVARRSPQETQERVAKSLRRRYWAERRFRLYGILAVLFGIAFVVFLFATIVMQGASVFRQSYVKLDVFYDPAIIDPAGTRKPNDIRDADYQALVRAALKERFPEVEGRKAVRDLARLVSSGAAFDLRDRVMSNPSLIGERETQWVLASDDVGMYMKGKLPHAGRDGGPLSAQQLEWIAALEKADALELRFNETFFTHGDSREPEQAGVWGAVVGSAFTLVLTLALSFPIGVAAAIYLEEFAHKNRWTDLIEVNINNLAAVPSIVFGLLGLAVFIGFFGLPRSSPLVGALVLTLLTLPTIIIASRAALKGVPPSIREAALGMGASQVQMVVHHVLPLAMPGMLTGTIIGMARALGETAPLLMIGMVAFIVDVPKGFTDPATVLPVQVFLWSDSPERAFVERTSGAIIVLLAFLVIMNAAAVVLRNRFEKRW
ncbi:MAG TPA: phosphate ABC transporter permease PstA [Steroidobacteraceae bacterium]|nr:phosphate ABC transporter permease PstA [Steroidobacteraceae bacterium]